jgi:hypothetical protein
LPLGRLYSCAPSSQLSERVGGILFPGFAQSELLSLQATSTRRLVDQATSWLKAVPGEWLLG